MTEVATGIQRVTGATAGRQLDVAIEMGAGFITVSVSRLPHSKGASYPSDVVPQLLEQVLTTLHVLSQTLPHVMGFAEADVQDPPLRRRQRCPSPFTAVSVDMSRMAAQITILIADLWCVLFIEVHSLLLITM